MKNIRCCQAEVLDVPGLLSPAGTPPAMVVALNRPIAQIRQRPEILKAVAAYGTDVAPGTPEELQVVIDNALALATRLVKDLGLKLN